jgi:hypothetical protein
MAYLASNKLGNYSAVAGEWLCRKHAALLWSLPKGLSQVKRQLAEIPMGYLPSISADPAFWKLMLEHRVFNFFYSIGP